MNEEQIESIINEKLEVV